MIVVPAMDLMGGRCVQLVGGDPRTRQAMRGSPVSIARRWEKMGATRLHVIDLDAALGSGSNEKAAADIIASVEMSVQVGGGVRDEGKTGRLIDAGATEIIVGTRAVKDVEWLGALARKYRSKIIVAVDARGGEISIEGWTAGSGRDLYDYVRAIDTLPTYGLLYTNIDVEGRLKGVDLAPVRQLALTTGKRLFVAGGVTTERDIASLARCGAYGAVLGMSIYKGMIDLRSALRRCGK